MSAASIMRAEARAIEAVAARVDERAFTTARDLLLGCDGTVATVGAGTSGIVARKVAATLTSTGTPAFFVHPADALHGGLGLIGEQEIALAVSNSGETDEVLALLPYLLSRSVPIIALVGRPASTLGRAADVVLDAGVTEEADPHDIVPTSSVVAALALVDALALAVMAAKGVTPEGFAANHPSGRLGRRLTLRVRDVFATDAPPPIVGPDADLVSAAAMISAGGAGAAAVVESQRLVGLVTDGDVRRVIERHGPQAIGEVTVRQFMTTDPVTVGPDVMAYEALRLMEDRPSAINVLPVIDGASCIAILRLHDLARLGL